ncbi:transglutaminase-like domain-containing protein [Lysobacter sp. 5GHs7-4]|uniref:transglutaminase-like domain-containing protein n=1 Tax=Lysobacter sp. 5GHs7-4 TaxID=2904253 RepID=UPI001E651924|nr:transglutaminase-like domain-containing protein [Lysobacter sp. 5GHs7-4]UHQ23171.1 transglutaminase-like domain-containing protein [Lysobacter sp. 5GHs7-4]
MRSSLRAARPLTLAAALAAAAAQAAPPAPAPALAATETQARALIQARLVASPYKMSERARNGRIRYMLAFEPAMVWPWPATGEQRVRLRDASASSAQIDICADCGDEAAPDAAQLRHYRGANAWIDSDERSVRAFARAHARGNGVERRMQSLVQAVQQHMNGPISYREYLSASQALAARGGDCTEFALLLAALGRAQGIPTRIAYGVAYSSRFVGQSHVFGPHVWVQAWNGQRWLSYDAGLGRFDSGHIALRIGDGLPQDSAGVMAAIGRLKVVEATGVTGDAR